MNDLPKLNRLRVNAGKTELKSWKASKDALAEAIATLEGAGHTDALPGANIKATPATDDPELKPVVETLADSAMSKNIPPPDEKKPDEKKPRATLAPGLDTDQMARQSRYAVRVAREHERRDAKAERKAKKLADKEAAGKKPKVKLSKQEKRAIKEEAASRKIAGQVNEKTEPEKAARQKKHIADKKAAREAKPKTDKDTNEVTVAELCRELDIDPKVGRAKLRRHEDKLTKLHTKGQDRWTFPKSAAAEIKSILKPK